MSEELETLRQHVTELEQQARVWQEKAARYREIAEMFFDHTYSVRIESDGSFVREIDRQGLIKLTGFTEQEIDDLDRAGLVHPDDRAVMFGRNEPLMAGKPAVDEYRMLTRSGAYLRVRDIAHPVWDEQQGRVVRIYGGIKLLSEGGG